MPQRAVAVGLGLGLLLGAWTLASTVAHADVPRSCVHPRIDRLACQAETRRVQHEVLPSARLQVLREQEAALAEVGTLQERERNELLRQIRRELRQAGYNLCLPTPQLVHHLWEMMEGVD